MPASDYGFALWEVLRRLIRLALILTVGVFSILVLIGLFHPAFYYIFLFARSIVGYILHAAADGAKYLLGPS